MDKERVLELIQELNEKQTETICIEAKTANKGKPEKYYDFSGESTYSEEVQAYDKNELQRWRNA